jgi:ketosteroid isomerase-like protein
MLRISAVALSLLFFVVLSAKADDPYLLHANMERDSLFMSGNTESLTQLYADDAVVYPADASIWFGKADIKANVEARYADYNTKVERCLLDLLATDTWAIEWTHYTRTVTSRTDGGKVMETGRCISCRKKVNGVWKIAWEDWKPDVNTGC